MSKEAMKLALEAMERYQVKRQDFDRFAEEITALREALADQPAQIAGFDVVLDSSMPPNAMKFVQPAQQDIPDLIAGALGVSRGTAYDLMREALAEQPAQQQEPVAYAGVKAWVGNKQVIQCVTQTELHYATQPWLLMLMNAEKCIAALKENT